MVTISFFTQQAFSMWFIPINQGRSIQWIANSVPPFVYPCRYIWYLIPYFLPEHCIKQCGIMKHWTAKWSFECLFKRKIWLNKYQGLYPVWTSYHALTIYLGEAYELVSTCWRKRSAVIWYILDNTQGVWIVKADRMV